MKVMTAYYFCLRWYRCMAIYIKPFLRDSLDFRYKDSCVNRNVRPVSTYSHTLEHPNQVDQSKAISRIVSEGFDETIFLLVISKILTSYFD